MTKYEVNFLSGAINSLADATDTLTGAERAEVVAIMQRLSDMRGGPKVDIEACLAEVEASVAITH